jgi:transposase, IS5 family
LQFLRGNLGYIEEVLPEYPHGTPIPLPNWLLCCYWVLPHLCNQQLLQSDATAVGCFL